MFDHYSIAREKVVDDFDMDELQALFLEECAENVDVLESGLLEMGNGALEKEALDGVFRAAHSIKGGGATFGYAALSELTHHLEAYLECLRSGVLQSDDNAVQAMLSAVDVIRDMLDSTDSEQHDQHPRRVAVMAALQSLVGNSTNAQMSDSDLAPVTGSQRWIINFSPNADIATRGNDPYLTLRELATLGHVSSEPDESRLPSWEDYDPLAFYLSWRIDLETDVGREGIAEVFEWVEFDCVLSIEAGSVAEEVSAVAAPEHTHSKAATTSTASALPQPTKPAKPTKPGADAGTMRIPADKIDRILDLVGELVITQSMLSRSGRGDGGIDTAALLQCLDLLERNTRELQESVMKVRMLPISFAFGRLPRMIRDLSKQLGKQVDLVLEGETTEVDKTVLDHILDPLVHLVRNAVDHGLEDPDTRLANGKPETGQICLRAYHQSGSIVIKIEDDGAGINVPKVLQIARDKGLVSKDEELSDNAVQQLIFAPGFSTAETVSEVSGRGVGMDVVRRNIVDLGGTVAVESQPGLGSLITITLPLTLAILEGQLVSVGEQTFVVPVVNIVEIVELRKYTVSDVPGVGQMANFRERYIPLVNLKERLLGVRADQATDGELVLVVDVHGSEVGLLIDGIEGQQQVVIKSLEENYQKVDGVSGATIMSDGSVAMILDAAAFFNTDESRFVA